MRNVSFPAMHVALGGRIRRRRRELGLTVRDVVARSGLSRGYISQVENGIRGMSMDSVVVLAAALRVDYGWFFEEVGR